MAGRTATARLRPPRLVTRHPYGRSPGSRFHTTEFFGPILGIMKARTLRQAIEWQNATDYGLTAGIHSLDAKEVNTWIDSVQAGNLYVNRGITGAIVQRQPFGGWKRSSVGTTAKAGGPNYLTHLGTWRPRPLRAAETPELSREVSRLLDAARAHVSGAEHRDLIAAAGSDHIAWTREYGVLKDVSKLGVERNVFRYVPVPVAIRFDGNFLPELIRVLLAAARTGAPIAVSSRTPLPAGLAPKARVETHDEWLAHIAATRPPRIRLVGHDAKDVAVAVDGDPDVAIYAGPVTPSGRVEALPFLQEQSVTITNHRFGNHDPEFELVLPRKP